MLSIKIGILLLCLSMTEASLKITRSSRDGRHPKALELEMSLPENGKSVRIPLSRTDAFESMPVTVMQNGVSRTFSARQLHHDSHAHYNDIESKAVISVRDVDGHKQFSGHFMHEGRSYFVEPIGKSHNVRAEPITPQQLQQHQEMQKMQKSLSRKRRQTNNAATDNIIEVAVCIDSTVYSGFYAINGSAALTEIHYYYTHIMNGVDVTFRNIPAPQTFSVRSISLTVSQTAGDDAWMPSASTANRDEGSVILQSLAAYKQGLSVQPDHVMAFTRMDVKGSGSSGVIGMAYLSAVCQNNGVSINEDLGMQSWGTAAHELGHNMGSHHDGSSNGCSSSSQNVMAPSSTFYTLSNVANSYHFSECSIGQMKAYANSLGSSNCMAQNTGTQVQSLAKTARAGTRLTLDSVCKMSTQFSNPGKFFLTSDASTNPALICAQIFCYTSSGSGGSTGGMRAPEGTPCGSQKSCNWNGQCADDSQAPVTPANCFWGDTYDAASCASWVNYFDQVPSAKPSYCPAIKPNCCRSAATACAGY